MNEFADEYSESLGQPPAVGPTDLRDLQEALVSHTVSLLAPSQPIALTRDMSVQKALDQMVLRRRSAVVIVDADGRLEGIFTERDVLIRVLGQGRDPRDTMLAEVMTPNPEALSAQDRISYAINRMSIAGYRTIPLVDADRRSIGIVTVNDVVKWLAEIFPEAILNLPPGDRIKNPQQLDAG